MLVKTGGNKKKRKRILDGKLTKIPSKNGEQKEKTTKREQITETYLIDKKLLIHIQTRLVQKFLILKH